MNIGRLLIVAGLALVFIGVLFLVFERLNLPFGRLPGDIVYRGKNTTVYVPWVTCLVLSALLTLILWLFNSRR
jgi:hypothetical protein